jgi:hypothetical protein
MKFISRHAEFFEFYLSAWILFYCEVISTRILIIFALEEAAILKIIIFILA